MVHAVLYCVDKGAALFPAEITSVRTTHNPLPVWSDSMNIFHYNLVPGFRHSLAYCPSAHVKILSLVISIVYELLSCSVHLYSFTSFI
jgi:hypothetical protein